MLVRLCLLRVFPDIGGPSIWPLSFILIFHLLAVPLFSWFLVQFQLFFGSPILHKNCIIYTLVALICVVVMFTLMHSVKTFLFVFYFC